MSNVKLLRFVFIIFAILNGNLKGFSQIQNERVDSIKYSAIKRELASFCKGNTSFRNIRNIVEVLPHFCSDSLVSFNIGSTYINIKAKEIIQDKRRVKVIDKMDVIVHSKFKIKINDSDLKDVIGINFYPRDDTDKVEESIWCKLVHHLGLCEYQKYKSSLYYKVFYSVDNRRFYIYLLLGQEKQLEMVWIFNDDKYFGRIVESL